MYFSAVWSTWKSIVCIFAANAFNKRVWRWHLLTKTDERGWVSFAMPLLCLSLLQVHSSSMVHLPVTAQWVAGSTSHFHPLVNWARSSQRVGVPGTLVVSPSFPLWVGTWILPALLGFHALISKGSWCRTHGRWATLSSVHWMAWS